jgi:hypothetical protein
MKIEKQYNSYKMERLQTEVRVLKTRVSALEEENLNLTVMAENESRNVSILKSTIEDINNELVDNVNYIKTLETVAKDANNNRLLADEKVAEMQGAYAIIASLNEDKINLQKQIDEITRKFEILKCLVKPDSDALAELKMDNADIPGLSRNAMKQNMARTVNLCKRVGIEMRSEVNNILQNGKSKTKLEIILVDKSLSILDAYDIMYKYMLLYADELACITIEYNETLTKGYQELMGLIPKDSPPRKCKCGIAIPDNILRGLSTNILSSCNRLGQMYMKTAGSIPLYSAIYALNIPVEDFDLTKDEFNKKYKLVRLRNDEECSMCLNELDCKSGEGDLGKEALPCGHVFHKRCIFTQFLQCDDKCPLCRATYTANIIGESKKQKPKWREIVAGVIASNRISKDDYATFFTTHNMKNIFASVL